MLRTLVHDDIISVSLHEIMPSWLQQYCPAPQAPAPSNRLPPQATSLEIPVAPQSRTGAAWAGIAPVISHAAINRKAPISFSRSALSLAHRLLSSRISTPGKFNIATYLLSPVACSMDSIFL
ncbi:MAG TPA: hypothetical protein VMF50_10740 [Candidatus Binataceae bacterium]|nr:hypothetical protein [Candidatus Binataceae bacterium]